MLSGTKTREVVALVGSGMEGGVGHGPGGERDKKGGGIGLGGLGKGKVLGMEGGLGKGEVSGMEVLGWLRGSIIAKETLAGLFAFQRKISPSSFPAAIHFPSCDHAHAETLTGSTGMSRTCDVKLELETGLFDTTSSSPCSSPTTNQPGLIGHRTTVVIL